MSFVDPLFIFFLALVIPVHHALRRGFESPWPFLLFLLAVSSFFYALLYPPHLALLFLSSLVAWGGARLLRPEVMPDGAGLGGGFSNGRLYAVGVILILLPLAYFKYYNFILESLAFTGLHAPKSAFVLPLGISFFTFQNISYLTDVHRGTVAPERNFIRYLCYITFFPHVQAGPIMTAREFLPQLYTKKEISREDLGDGMFYLLGGYLKKAVLADRLAAVADPAFAAPGAADGPGLLVAALAYSLQIYFDFSGYSDIAIGLGRLLGYRIPENFLFPYSAGSIREFWRRWHITLSSWLRDHIYIPLGGSRHGASRTALALFATMLLGGLWHGAHWNFVIWGAAHGLLLGMGRLWGKALGRGGSAGASSGVIAGVGVGIGEAGRKAEKIFQRILSYNVYALEFRLEFLSVTIGLLTTYLFVRSL
ncbi:MAG: MBOAT family protein, partial [Spirochaetia bacterium]|nr:MBOAT family protein [Spirochaetia bacterium]